MVKFDVYMLKFKGKYAISDFYGMRVLSCPNGVIGWSLSNPKHLCATFKNCYPPKIICDVYPILGHDINLITCTPTRLVFSFPEFYLDKLAKVLKISKRGVSSLPVLVKSCG
jgi:hypothetical protein